MTEKHTPGPWHYQEESDRYTHIVRAGDRFLCQLAQDTGGEAEANARLMAAAPDLLKAAKEVFEFSPFHRADCKGVTTYEEGVIFDTRVGCDCYLSRLRATCGRRTRGRARL